MRRHLVTEIAKKTDTPVRIQASGQIDRLDAPAGGGIKITLLAWASKSVGQVDRVQLPVTDEGFVE